MEGVAAEAAVSKITEDVVSKAEGLIWRQIGYVWNYDTNIKELKREVEKLEAERKSLEHRVEEARRNGEEIEEKVNIWLKEAEEKIKAGKDILEENGQASKNCCSITGCPNLKTRHRFGRRAKKQMPIVDGVTKGGKFDSISYRRPLQGVRPDKDYEDFESRMEVLEEIMEALKDADLNLIGVYGLSGVGKTTLVKKVAEKVKDDGNYNAVVLANVTKNANVKRIQGEIADWLGFGFDVETPGVRAERLSQRFQQEEKVLVILDDIWEIIKLEDIGIPIGSDHRGCKVLMTSRNLNVLKQMGVEKDFLLQALGPEEAWHLFEKKAFKEKVDYVKDSSLEDNAKEIAKRCAGLPVLILAVATSLKGKELGEWRDALEGLKRFDNDGDEEKVASTLLLSYNTLTNEEKSLFRLCGQLRPQFMTIRSLLKYSIGLGLFNRCNTVGQSRDRIIRLLNGLKNACLLLEGDDDQRVKMHEVIHGFASSIASKYHHFFTVADDVESVEWPAKEILQQCKAISLQCSKIPKLPEQFDCPNLESFTLYNNDSSLKIPDSLFNMTEKLKVLFLSNVKLSPQFLENLQSLCLDYCDFDDNAAIGELKNLRVLSLVGSSIDRLPEEVRKLTRLQLLDLSECQRLEVIPAGVLSCLTQLEDLYMGNSFVKWENGAHESQSINASLAELKLLPKLVSIEFHISDAEMLPEDLFSRKLEQFRIFIGDEWDWSGNYETSKTLKLKLNRSIELERVKPLLDISEDLLLENLKGVRSVLYELDGEGFPKLKHLHIQNSQDVRYIVDSLVMHDIPAFQSLISLVLHNLNSLEKICQNQPMAGLFSNLRKLNVRNCNALKNLFSFSMFRSLNLLEEIDVNTCTVMEGIVAEGNDDTEVLACVKLRSLALEHLPKFESFFCQMKEQEPATVNAGCREITTENHSETSLLFSKKIQLSGLTDLTLSSITVKKIWPTGTEAFPSVKNLTHLSVDGCGNLSNLFTSNMVKNFDHLKKLEISNCNFMEEVIVGKDEIESNILPKLEFLRLKCLPELIRFCTSNLIEYSSLKALWIERCPQLQTFISSPTSNTGAVQESSILFDEKVSFPKLEELHVLYMQKLKTIWIEELRADSFGKLKRLRVEHGNELLKIFPSEMLRRFPDLEQLVVENCNLVEEIFDSQALVRVQETSYVSKLKTLWIRNLPNLKYVWNEDADRGIPSFRNLFSVIVSNCPGLRNLFPYSIVQSRLPLLECLDVQNCGVEEIVAKDDGAIQFELPRLKTLVFWKLKKLKCFYPSEHTLSCPLLQSLTVCRCENLEIFTSEAKQQIQGSPQNFQAVQPLFSFRKIIHSLKELSLNYKHIMMIRQGQFPLELFHKLKLLHLQSFGEDSSNFPIDLLQKFTNLERLHLTDCYLEVLLPNGTNVGTLSQIRILHLNGLPYLRHLWNPDCEYGEVLQNLQTLKIWGCHSLIIMAPSTASFRSLTTLEVWRCNGLASIVSWSTAKSMVNLTNLSITECNVVTEIVASEVADEFQSQTEITFYKLASLKIHCLRSLSNFCSSASCIIKFPSLEEVIVSQCPRMKVFSHGVLSAPKLKKVIYLMQERDKWHWIGDLNTTIRHLYKQMIGFSGIQELKLSEFPELKELWHDRIPFNCFFDLGKLVVDECEISPSSIPSKLLPILNNLEELEVRNCILVEQVFGSGVVGYLSKLTKLHLIDLPKLRLLWNDVPKGSFEFKNLKILKVEGCSKLRSVFTPSMCLGLVQLQDLQVKNCDLMAEIITQGLADEEETDKVINFPLLNFITLETLPRLMNFSSGSRLVQCPSLKEMAIVDCPTTFTSTILREAEDNAEHGVVEPKLNFPNLNELKLRSIKIEKLWRSVQLEMSSSFINLMRLTVDGCDNLKYILSSSMLKTAVHLKSLEICDCKMVKEIMVLEEETHRILLPEVEFLKLRDLPELAQFCKSELIECPLLKELSIENCPQLMKFVSNSSNSNSDSSELEVTNSTLFDEKVGFPNLEKLVILNMDSLKMIWSYKLHPNSFSKMEVLKVDHCNSLLKLFPSNMLRTLKNLNGVSVKNCDSLEVVFDLKELVITNQTAANELRTLYVDNLPNLKHVWKECSQGLVLFGNLSSLYVWKCPNIKFLFPTSIATSLPLLETLNIYNCGVVELVAKQEGVETTARFVFPLLKSLVLWSLLELKCFYPGIYTLDCPVLEIFRMLHCHKLKIFASQSDYLQHMNTESPEFQIHQQPLFQFTKIVHKLKHLTLMSEDVMMIKEDEYPERLFENVNVLEINCFHNASLSFPFDVLQRFQSMEILVVRSSQFEDIFPSEQSVGEEKYGKTLGQIKHLELYTLSRLRHIWNQVDHFVQSLETLKIWGCSRLISLAPSSASFQNLTTLDVEGCDGLVSLVASSTAKSLVQLTKMSIRKCNLLAEVIAEEADELKVDITFTKLKSLELICLPNLVSFCSAEQSFKFPSLTRVIVSQCPKMKVFSIGDLSTPDLRSVHLTKDEKDKGRWNGNLNATIKQLSIDMVGFHGLERLELSRFPDLKERWHGGLPFDLFYKLRSLVVNNSAFRSGAIPSNLLPSLDFLKKLEIRNCDFLEEIFDSEFPNADKRVSHLSNLETFKLTDLPQLKHLWNKEVSKGLADFRNLKLLTIVNCGSLRDVFTPTMIPGLEQLQEIKVWDCPMLEEVITNGGPDKPSLDKIVFARLNSISLVSLPRLTSFYLGTGILECPCLKELYIQTCPQMLEFVSNSASEDERSILETSALFDEKVSFPNLEDLRISHVDNLKMIWSNQLHRDSFSKIEVLKLKLCEGLLTIFPSGVFMMRSLQNLKDLIIQNCNSVEFVFDFKELTNIKETVVSQLTNLKINNLPNLKRVWNDDPQGLVFDKLNSVNVKNCSSLKSLFPALVAKRLPQLKALDITDCGVEELVAMDEEGERTTPHFVFPLLEDLVLFNLKELQCFYPGIYTLDCPVLDKLTVCHSGRQETFAFESKHLEEMQKEIQIPQPLFSFIKIVPKLNFLTLTSKDAMMIKQSQYADNLFEKVEYLGLTCYHDASLTFPFDLLQRFHYVEALLLACSQFDEVFPSEGFVVEEKCANTLGQITDLLLYNLPQLKHIWNKASLQVDHRLFQSLTCLGVWRCDRLISLEPSSACFRNLTTLEVDQCNGLVSLVASSTAKSLSQLTKLRIKKCNLLAEVIASEADELKEDITFTKLESLELKYLPSFVSFCSSEHSLKFPSLTEVVVKECPNMRVFSNGDLSAPDLQSVQLTKNEILNEGRWKGNLNATIEKLFLQKSTTEKGRSKEEDAKMKTVVTQATFH